jgi:hypothetical protein
MLGFDVSERSVARHLRRVPRRGDPASRWSAFLHSLDSVTTIRRGWSQRGQLSLIRAAA